LIKDEQLRLGGGCEQGCNAIKVERP
jgi:hypothetical protein